MGEDDTDRTGETGEDRALAEGPVEAGEARIGVADVGPEVDDAVGVGRQPPRTEDDGARHRPIAQRIGAALDGEEERGGEQGAGEGDERDAEVEGEYTVAPPPAWEDDRQGAERGLQNEEDDHQWHQQANLDTVPPEGQCADRRRHDQEPFDAGDRAVAIFDRRRHGKFGHETTVAEGPGGAAPLPRAGVGHRRAGDQDHKHPEGREGREPFHRRT